MLPSSNGAAGSSSGKKSPVANAAAAARSKMHRKRRPSRSAYSPLASSSGATMHPSGTIDEEENGSFSDDDDDDAASTAHSEDKLFIAPSAAAGDSANIVHNLANSFSRLMENIYTSNSSPRYGGAVAPVSPISPSTLAPSLLSDDDLPQEPQYFGPSAINDSMHDIAPDFFNAVPRITPVSSQQFLSIVEDVRLAIAEGIYPQRIAKGSSGSYFCRNRAGEIVGVFKPKNEEPYGKMNPKWTKWIHRNLLPCCFGRSCLIPNLGYLSEAAASYLDRRMGLNVVPRTEVVSLASPTFFYSPKERQDYRRGRPLPPKLGSFQLFLKGFKDATTFFREGYDRLIDAEGAGSNNRDNLRGGGSSRGRGAPRPLSSATSSSTISLSSAAHPYNWTDRTQREFQWGFERLVILDYLIRNTDRGLDNWMIRYVPEAERSPPAPQPVERVLTPSGGSGILSSSSAAGLKQRGLPLAASAATVPMSSVLTSSASQATVVPDDPLSSLSPPSGRMTPKSDRVDRPAALLNLSPMAPPPSSLANTQSSAVVGSAATATVPNTLPLSPLRNGSQSNGRLSPPPLAPSPPPPQPDMSIEFYHQMSATPNSLASSTIAPIPTAAADAPLQAISSTIPARVPPPETGVTIHVAAIDNGLAFPYKHPDRWRAYPYGWASLPISRIPFSAATRQQALHFLTSPTWWNETLDGLEKVFRIDPDFEEGMWRRQRSVIRGEGYNLAEVLRRAEMGDAAGGSPSSLVTRPVVCVYEEELEHNGGGGTYSDEDGGLGGDISRRWRRVKLRFETFARNKPCFPF